MVNINVSFNGIIFYNNCRNSDMLYWSRAFELILYLAGLTSWCLRIKFPPSLFMNTMNYFSLLIKFVTEPSQYLLIITAIPLSKKEKNSFFTIQSLWHSDSHSYYKSLQSWKGAHHSMLEQTRAHRKINNSKINLIQSFFYSNDNNNKKQHFNCSVKKKQEVNIMLIWGLIIILIILTLTVGLVNLHHQLLDNVHYILLRNLQEKRLFRTVPILNISRLAKYHDFVVSLTILRPISHSHKFTTYFLHCLQKTHWRISKAHFQIRGQTQSTENT